MILTKTFKSGRSQAIRVPKEYRLPEGEVYMNQVDGVLMIVPKDRVWDVFDAAVERFAPDALLERCEEQPDIRETF